MRNLARSTWLGVVVGVTGAVGYSAVVVVAAGLPMTALGFAIVVGAFAGAAGGAILALQREFSRHRVRSTAHGDPHA